MSISVSKQIYETYFSQSSVLEQISGTLFSQTSVLKQTSATFFVKSRFRTNPRSGRFYSFWNNGFAPFRTSG